MLFFATGFGQINTDSLFISKFENIATNPITIRFSNHLKVNNSGGHLQGIQLFEKEYGKYVFLSGSSDSYAYSSVVKLGDKNEVISVNRLMDKPFKHAGGFQIYQNYLAVGIEDNLKKDKSKVCIYDISEPENPVIKPIATIERAGKPFRSTAGCVGITNYKNKALVVVGDWDTKHLDFYSAEFDDFEKDSFKLIFSIDTDTISKKGWNNKNWSSYQNINLLNFNHELYLIGLGQNNKNEDIADLFALKTKIPDSFKLKKLATKKLICQNECSFKAAAGVVFTKTGDLNIISSAYQIENISYLNYFKASINEK